MKRELSVYRHEAQCIGELNALPEKERAGYCDSHGLPDFLFTDVSMRTHLAYLEKKENKAEWVHDRYKGVASYEYDTWRKKKFDEIVQMEDPFEQVSAFEEASEQIRDAIVQISYLKAHRFYVRLWTRIELCQNMMRTGKYTLTDVCELIPDTDMADLYEMATRFMKIKVQTTEKEREILRNTYPEIDFDNPKWE